MKLIAFGGAAVAALSLAVSASWTCAADISRPVGVVELFTSQGCNSCPPADDVLAELGRRGDVVALGYHVDYWDYLGWGDTLATRENTARQRDYLRTFGNSAVYTPQAVINGRTHVNGAIGPDIDNMLTKLAGEGNGLDVKIDVTRNADSLVISTGAATGPIVDAHVVIVSFAEAEAVDVTKGENAGRKIVYWNPVTRIQAAGVWRGEPARFELPATDLLRTGTGGFAVLLQAVTADGAPGAILGAAMVGKEAI